jgi:hypothetical protein
MHSTRNVDLLLKRKLSVSGAIGRPVLRLHLAAKTQRTHIGPHGIDVVQARFLASRIAYSRPASRDFLVLGPERVLLFMIDNNYEHFTSLFRSHSYLPNIKIHPSGDDPILPAFLTLSVRKHQDQRTRSTTDQCKEIHLFAIDSAIRNVSLKPSQNLHQLNVTFVTALGI